jgi:hypothetical protein
MSDKFKNEYDVYEWLGYRSLNKGNAFEKPVGSSLITIKDGEISEYFIGVDDKLLLWNREKLPKKEDEEKLDDFLNNLRLEIQSIESYAFRYNVGKSNVDMGFETFEKTMEKILK